MPKVSIITPCYNAEKYIQETYESLKNQTFKDWEWIVVDDSSKDNSYKILEDLQHQDERIKLFKNEENLKVSKTRNKGIKEASGDYIALLDADDLWLPDKLETQVSWHEEGEKFTFHTASIFKDEVTLGQKKGKGKITRHDLLKNNVIHTSSVMVDSSITKRHPFKEGLSYGEDLLFFIDIISETKFAHGHENIFSKYRLHENSLSKNKINMAKNRWKIYRQHLKLPFLTSLFYFVHYGITAFLKYSKWLKKKS